MPGVGRLIRWSGALAAAAMVAACGATIALGADGGPGDGAPAWSRADAVVFTDAGEGVTAERILKGRLLPEDADAAAHHFATMTAKEIRARFSSRAASGPGAKEITRTELDQMVRYLAETAGTQQASLRGALDYDAALLQALIEEAMGGDPAEAGLDESQRTRIGHLKLMYPTLDAQRERLRTIQSEPAEFAAYGEPARTLMERVRAAEAIARAPVVVSDTEIRRAQERRTREAASAPPGTARAASRFALSMELRLERSERIVLAEILEAIERGEIVIHDRELAERVKAALAPGSGIGLL